MKISPWVFRSLLLGWSLVLILLAVWSGPSLAPDKTFSFFWNLAHALCYGALAPLFVFSYSPNPRKPYRGEWNDLKHIRAMLYVGSLGLLTEWLQTKTAQRSGSFFDLLTDLAGGIAFLGFLVLRFRHPKQTSYWVSWSAVSLFICSIPAALDTF